MEGPSNEPTHGTDLVDTRSNMPPRIGQASGKPEVIALHVQSWATAGAFIVGTVALLLTMTAISEQRAANAFQQALDAHAEQSRQAQQASRVTWDAQLTSGSLRLQIENRSPATIRDLVLLADSGRLALLLGNLAACTAIEVDVTAALNPADAGFWLTPELMYFRDPKASWVLEETGLRSASEADLARLRSFVSQAKRNAGPLAVVSSGEHGVGFIIPVVAAVVARKRIVECCGN